MRSVSRPQFRVGGVAHPTGGELWTCVGVTEVVRVSICCRCRAGR